MTSTKQRIATAASTGISSWWLPLLRIAWILVVLLSIGLSVISWSIIYERALTGCQNTTCEQALVNEGDGISLLGLQSLGLSARASLVVMFAIGALAMLPYFAIALILYSRRFNERVGVLGAFMLPAFAAVAVGPASLLVEVSSVIGILTLIIAIIGQSTFLIFFFIFPDGRFVPRWTMWVATIWTAAFVLALPFGYDPFDYIGLGFFFFIAAVIGAQIYRYRKVSNTIEKQQTKWVVIGLTISLGGFLLLLVLFSFIPRPDQFPPIGALIFRLLIYILLSSIPVFIGVAILRNRLWDIEVVINRALIYGPLSVILAAVFAALIALINQSAREIFGTEATASAAVVSALIVATIFQPLRTRIETSINKRFFPDNINLNKEFIEFSPEARSVIGLKDLLKVVARKTTGLVNGQHTAILLANKGTGYRRVEAYPSAGKGAATFKPDKFVQAELQKGRAVSKGNQQGLWVPLYLRRMRSHDVIGILDIGPRTNKAGFSSDDKKALSQLGAEIGTSIYIAQLREKRN